MRVAGHQKPFHEWRALTAGIERCGRAMRVIAWRSMRSVTVGRRGKRLVHRGEDGYRLLSDWAWVYRVA